MYIYIYIYTHIYTYIYIYIHTDVTRLQQRLQFGHVGVVELARACSLAGAGGNKGKT